MASWIMFQIKKSIIRTVPCQVSDCTLLNRPISEFAKKPNNGIVRSMIYESDLLNDWYVLFHYGGPDEILDGSAFCTANLPEKSLSFPLETVRAFQQTTPVGRALDVGCAVGRSGYELSKIAREVIGIDFSQKFIETATALKSGRPYAYQIYGEAHLSKPLHAHLPSDCDPGRVSFEQGDAMNLRHDLGCFDLVHAANLLCRLPEPIRFLARLPSLLKPGGKLILATPATWMQEYTRRENIPTGPTLEFLKEHLDGAFDLQSVSEIPFLMREHQRKFQLSTSQTSLWVRRVDS